jgi:hypothetical protein
MGLRKNADQPPHCRHRHRAQAQPAQDAPVPAIQRIVQARKPGSKPYLSLNMPKAPSDPNADRKVRAFLKKMMPDHPLLHDDD